MRPSWSPGNSGRPSIFASKRTPPSTFFPSNLRGTPEWDAAAGFSFWVKGDGTDGFGGIQFIYDEDYAVRYDFCFPVKGTDWTKVVVAWTDLIPVLPGPKAKPLGSPGGNLPSKLTGLWFGKWWYWGKYPATPSPSTRSAWNRPSCAIRKRTAPMALRSLA